MRIVDTRSTPKTDPVNSDRTGDPKRASSAKKAGQPADRVELSKVSGKMAESLSADHAARAAKVSRIAAAVESGNYKVDPHAIARSMVDQAITGGDESSGGTE